MNDLLRVALVQTDIVWEDKERNRERCAQVLERLSGRCDLAVLPEMFTTGFSMRAEELSEPVSGPTVEALVSWARQY
ncbi:MAG TPA: nitrilase family protein, partial [Candidatus Barnesiella excrementavium]|nr:nitrilase family protein [Candidatus Barnesiella excrementavium]